MNDQEIIQLYRSGKEEQAFNEIVRSYSERLYWLVRDLVLSHEDTNDLLQDIFIKIWAALPSFRGEAQLFTWLYRIATNETINYLNKKKVRAALSFTRIDDEVERVVQSDPYFNGDEIQRELVKAIATLPPKQRAVFTMRYYQEMKYEQMAEILGSSVSSLKASYHFAYEKVKSIIEKKLSKDF